MSGFVPARAEADTICAIATGAGGGVGIVRISGPEAEAILTRIVSPFPAHAESHRLYLGRARDPESGAVLDEVLACLMRAPRSYTGGMVGEIHGHGGEANLAALLRLVLRSGARLAEPGEFTRRAFLGGRMDLAQAEAVAQVIAARSERALRMAQAQRAGALSDRVNALRKKLAVVLAEIEARVDFPDDRLDFVPSLDLARTLGALTSEISALGASFPRGRLIAEGIDVALVGRPNAGKSSLLNALVGEERALVDAAPGTTRDFLEAEVEVDGLRLVLVDTAGEREAAGEVERRGLALGRKRRKRADVMVLVVDGAHGYGEVERSLVAEREGAPLVIAWNKCDLAPPRGLPEHLPCVATSVAPDVPAPVGLSALRQLMRETAGDVGEESLCVTTARQQGALDEAAAALLAAATLLKADAPPELPAVDLRIALDRLGRVTGESVDGDVLDEIFARFCIGK